MSLTVDKSMFEVWAVGETKVPIQIRFRLFLFCKDTVTCFIACHCRVGACGFDFLRLSQVVKIGEAMTRDTLDDDKCKAYADSILQAWRLFCTPRSCDEDTALFKHILTSIVAWSSDRCPAILKTARFLRKDCPNLNFIYGDPCHVIRTVTGLLEQTFTDAEEILFQDKHSLIPSIMFSNEWRSKLLWAQEVVKAHEGPLGSVLQVALKHFKYVKPRWESSATPRRRMCHLIVPAALLLATTAADARTSRALRERLELGFKSFTQFRICGKTLFSLEVHALLGPVSAKSFCATGSICRLG